tara:strand:+ start:2831 stop:4096 length:1266 start_codon:yes stop_codon:yes gene_type:complete
MAGRARIAVTGIQDQWLSGDPSYSYFVTVFKRHTRFSTETVEIPFTGDFKLGSNLRSIIPNNVGDLVRSMTLKLQLGTLPTHTSTEKYYYNVPTAKSLLKYVDLKMGGQTIERLTGEYITMYDQLHSNKDDVNQTLYFLNGQGNHLTVSGSYDTFYVNLPFYFFRNPSLAIPVCALKKQMIEVELVFKDIDDGVTFKYTLQENGSVTRDITEDGRILNASVLIDFFFVTEDERNYLLTRPMDYLITQLQVSTIPFKPNESKKSALLKFVNPVKELFFVAKEDVGTQDTLLTTLKSDQSFSTAIIGTGNQLKRSDHRLIKNVRLDFNGKNIFDYSGTYLAYGQSLKYHTGCPDPAYEFYTYSFALDPEKYYPTGQVNMSRIIHKKLDVELDEVSTTKDIKVRVYALSFNILRIQGGLAGLKF